MSVRRWLNFAIWAALRAAQMAKNRSARGARGTIFRTCRVHVILDLAPFLISGFRRREAPPKPAFTVRALRARTANAKGARSELSNINADDSCHLTWGRSTAF
jgi:hypothetical protein